MSEKKKLSIKDSFRIRCAVILEGPMLTLESVLEELQGKYAEQVEVLYVKPSVNYLKIVEEFRITDEPRPRTGGD
jgi:hypothetical protein